MADLCGNSIRTKNVKCFVKILAVISAIGHSAIEGGLLESGEGVG